MTYINKNKVQNEFLKTTKGIRVLTKDGNQRKMMTGRIIDETSSLNRKVSWNDKDHLKNLIIALSK